MYEFKSTTNYYNSSIVHSNILKYFNYIENYGKVLLLQKNFKYIAVDKDCQIYAFKNKPILSDDNLTWVCSDCDDENSDDTEELNYIYIGCLNLEENSNLKKEICTWWEDSLYELK